MKLSDVKATSLNATCLKLIAQFSRVLKAETGVVLQLTDPNVVQEVVAHASRSKNPNLRRLCKLLLTEIRNHLSGAKPPPRARYPLYQSIDKGGSDSPDGKRKGAKQSHH